MFSILPLREQSVENHPDCSAGLKTGLHCFDTGLRVTSANTRTETDGTGVGGCGLWTTERERIIGIGYCVARSWPNERVVELDNLQM
jgi:hypothetical protein